MCLGAVDQGKIPFFTSGYLDNALQDEIIFFLQGIFFHHAQA